MTIASPVTQWLDTLAASVAQQRFVRLVLSKPTAEADDVVGVEVRPILVKRELKLSFTTRHRRCDIVKNYAPAQALTQLAALLDNRFTAAKLYTTQADLHLMRRHNQWQLSHHRATKTEPPALTHDRAKQHLLRSNDKPYLYALGVTDAGGQVLKRAQDKFRQINKYIEILDGLLRSLPPRDALRMVDMGAGKGYLTFALYDYVTTTLGMHAEMTGVESRPELVQQCNDIAQQSGFTGLRFVQGSIADYDCTGADAVIALHACDTATDDAIHKAIRAKAALIVVAPCCHKQIRRVMGKAGDAHPLGLLLQHGTYAERLGEMLTDAMRAQLMELAGYHTKLFEFVADAHTPRNVMIVAIRGSSAPDVRRMDQHHAALSAARTLFGLSAPHRLETLLAHDLQ